LGLLVAALPWTVRGTAVAWLLFVAAVIQAADVAIGARRRQAGMVGGAAMASVVHVVAGVAVL
jgi:hypothetical protein